MECLISSTGGVEFVAAALRQATRSSEVPDELPESIVMPILPDPVAQCVVRGRFANVLWLARWSVHAQRSANRVIFMRCLFENWPCEAAYNLRNRHSVAVNSTASGVPWSGATPFSLAAGVRSWAALTQRSPNSKKHLNME
eukprot:2183875-Amphidinium_carterae.2